MKRQEQGYEQEKSRSGARQKQGRNRSRKIAGQEQGKSRRGAGQEQGRSKNMAGAITWWKQSSSKVAAGAQE